MQSCPLCSGMIDTLRNKTRGSWICTCGICRGVERAQHLSPFDSEEEQLAVEFPETDEMDDQLFEQLPNDEFLMPFLEEPVGGVGFMESDETHRDEFEFQFPEGLTLDPFCLNLDGAGEIVNRNMDFRAGNESESTEQESLGSLPSLPESPIPLMTTVPTRPQRVRGTSPPPPNLKNSFGFPTPLSQLSPPPPMPVIEMRRLFRMGSVSWVCDRVTRATERKHGLQVQSLWIPDLGDVAVAESQSKLEVVKSLKPIVGKVTDPGFRFQKAGFDFGPAKGEENLKVVSVEIRIIDKLQYARTDRNLGRQWQRPKPPQPILLPPWGWEVVNVGHQCARLVIDPKYLQMMRSVRSGAMIPCRMRPNTVMMIQAVFSSPNGRCGFQFPMRTRGHRNFMRNRIVPVRSLLL